MTDNRTLINKVCSTIRTHRPDAVSFDITSSDQGKGGWFLQAVNLADGSKLEQESWTATDAFNVIEVDVQSELSFISWGAWGDANADTDLTIALPNGEWIQGKEQSA